MHVLSVKKYELKNKFDKRAQLTPFCVDVQHHVSIGIIIYSLDFSHEISCKRENCIGIIGKT